MIPIFSILLTIALPAFVMARAGKKPLRHPYLYSVASFMFCGVAMVEEIFTLRKRLFAGDIGGIEDTIGAVLIICIGLLVIALLLNLIALGVSYEIDGKKE